MVNSISSALARIKTDPHALLAPSVAENVCRELGLDWRQTPLCPPNAIALFVRQVAAGNVSCAELSRMAGGSKRLGVESRGDVEATVLQPYQSDISFCPTSHVDRSRLIKRRPFFKDRRRANSRIFGVRRWSPLWFHQSKAAMHAALQRSNPRQAALRLLSS